MTAPRLDALTGIRFVAAIAVFNAHVAAPVSAPAIVHTVSLAGHNWMTMFFVLSGLILAWNYDELLGDRLSAGGLRTYYVARLARIYPLYLLALLVVVLLRADLTGLPLHLLALQTWSGDLAVAYGFNGPGWSIGVELFLYALFPLLLVAFRRVRDNPRALLVIAVGAIAVAAAVTLALSLAGLAELPKTDAASAHRWIYRTPLTRLPDFVLGISLGYLLTATSGEQRATAGRALQVVGGAAVVALMLLAPVAESVWSLDVANMVPFALLMVGLVWSPQTLLARSLSTRPAVFLGEASFAFYLFHAVVVSVVGQPTGGLVSWATTWLAAFALTLFAAAGAHILVERPARIAVRRLLDPARPRPDLPDLAIEGHSPRQ